MNKQKIGTRLLAIVLALIMTLGVLPPGAFAADNISITVSVENTTFPVSAGAQWDGVLLESYKVEVPAGSTIATVTNKAFSENNIIAGGVESYISEINGLKPYDGDDYELGYIYSGWMVTQNDWFINVGVSMIALEDGDEIRYVYSRNMGEDCGGSWYNNDTSLKALDFSAGTLSPAFDGGEYKYTLTLPEGVNNVTITPTASNRNFQVRTSVDGTIFKRTQSVPVSDGTVIKIGCGDPTWPTMNNETDIDWVTWEEIYIGPIILTEYNVTVAYKSTEEPPEPDTSRTITPNANLTYIDKIIVSIPEGGTGEIQGEFVGGDLFYKLQVSEDTASIDVTVIMRSGVTWNMRVGTSGTTATNLTSGATRNAVLSTTSAATQINLGHHSPGEFRLDVYRGNMPVNRAPVVVGSSIVTQPVALSSSGTASISVSYYSNFSDPDGDPITYTVCKGSEILQSGTATYYSYTARSDDIGTLSFTVVASDGAAISEPLTFVYTVYPYRVITVTEDAGVMYRSATSATSSTYQYFKGSAPGGKVQLGASMTPADQPQEFTWGGATANVGVDQTGLLTINESAADAANVTLNVRPTNTASSTITSHSISVYIRNTFPISGNQKYDIGLPKDGSVKTLNLGWCSSNATTWGYYREALIFNVADPTVAAVNTSVAGCALRGLKEGTTTVTVTNKYVPDASVTLTVNVTQTNAPTSIELVLPAEYFISKGIDNNGRNAYIAARGLTLYNEPMQIELKVTPDGADLSGVNWVRTTNESMFNISADGKITITSFPSNPNGSSYIYFYAVSKDDPDMRSRECVAELYYFFDFADTQKTPVIALSENGAASGTPTLSVSSSLSGYIGEWIISDPSVIRLSGTSAYSKSISALRPGTSTVTLTTTYPGLGPATATVTVTGVKVEDSAGTSEATLSAVGDTILLTAYASPGETVRWSSVNPDVATVDENGLVTAAGAGLTRIYAEDTAGRRGYYSINVGTPVLSGLRVQYGSSTQVWTAIEAGMFSYNIANAVTVAYDYNNGGLPVTPAYNDSLFTAVINYSNIYGQPATYQFSSSGDSFIIPLKPGANSFSIRVTDRKNAENYSIYNLSITRTINTTTNLATPRIIPVGRELYSGIQIGGFGEGVLWYLNSSGGVTTGYSSGVKLYNTTVFSDIETVSLGTALTAANTYTAMRLRINGGEPGETYFALTDSPYVSLTGNTTTITVEICDEATYLSNIAEGKAEPFEVKNSYTFIIKRVNLPSSEAEALRVINPRIVGGELTGTLATPAFVPGYTTQLILPANRNGIELLFEASSGTDVYIGSGTSGVKMTPDESGTYHYSAFLTGSTTNAITFARKGESGTTVSIYTLGYTYTKNEPSRLFPTDVVDYIVPGSQYTNLAGYGLYPERVHTGSKVDNSSAVGGSVLSIGNYGGYVTFYYEEPIMNDPRNPYGIDFKALGNSLGGAGFAEPANVYVSQDNETWYLLAGSDYFDDNSLWNYEVTYIRNSDGSASWSDSFGGSGRMFNYPRKELYPLHNWKPGEDQSIAFRSTLLTGSGVDMAGSNSAGFPDWGYVDVKGGGGLTPGNPYNTPGGSGSYGDQFDISWAVDETGMPVHLDSISYIKIENASFINAGSIGEKSAEVQGVFRMLPDEAPVGKTAAPVGITINGKAVELEDGVYVYYVGAEPGKVSVNIGAEPGKASGEAGAEQGKVNIEVDIGDAPDTNVYINSQFGTNRTYEKLPREGIIRVLVQQSSMEPVIYYLDFNEPEQPPQTDKSALDNAIADAEALNLADYTAITSAALEAALMEAKAVSSNALATQKDVDDTLSALLAAVCHLRYKSFDFTWLGQGTQDDPYQIANAGQLAELRNGVGTGISYEDVYFEMVADIALPVDWTPIGSLINPNLAGGSWGIENSGRNVYVFSGILDGGGHTLTYAENSPPLFNYVRSATVRNLNIFGSYINGYGLVNKYFVDYGADGIYVLYLPTINLENVTILSGTKIKNSGFIGGFASGANHVNIIGCTAETGVIIGCDIDGNPGGLSNIGSFAGSFNGTVVNSVSGATVYGANNVGGLVGIKGQSIGPCSITNSVFTGSITATGNNVGGIVGSGYNASSAPNTPAVSVENCYVTGTVSGVNNVGGIFGGEPGQEECWVNGIGYIRNNHFAGTVSGTGSSVGAIIGFMRSLNRYNIITNNYYLDGCGVAKGIGSIEIIDTDLPNLGTGAVYINTFAYHRSDDPLGADAGKLTIVATAAQMSDGTVTAWLNSGEGSLQNWVNGGPYRPYPVHDEGIVTAVSLTISGDYKTEYFVGDTFSSEGLVIEIALSNGSALVLGPEDDGIQITGFDSLEQGERTITVSYMGVRETYRIFILPRPAEPIIPGIETMTVKFRLIGSTLAAEGKDVDLTGDDPAGYNGVEYVTWIATTSYTLKKGSTMYELFVAALKDAGLEHIGANKNYVETIYAPASLGGYALSELTNGPLSGWMYSVDGEHPTLGILEYTLSNGEDIVWHYVNDYRYEVKDWLSEKGHEAFGNGNLHNAWLSAPDSFGARGIPVLKTNTNGSGNDSPAGTGIIPGLDVPLSELENWNNPFGDVNESNWFYEAVRYLSAAGVINGTSDDTFSPQIPLSRAMFVTMLYRMEGRPGEDNDKDEDLEPVILNLESGIANLELGILNPESGIANLESGILNPDSGVRNLKFTDVPIDVWYTNPVLWAAENGIVEGYGDGHFGPGDDITREQLATILMRYAKWKGVDVSATTGLVSFTDSGEISVWARDAINWANATGLITGRTATTLAPRAIATRAEAAVLIMRFIETITATHPQEPTAPGDGSELSVENSQTAKISTSYWVIPDHVSWLLASYSLRHLKQLPF